MRYSLKRIKNIICLSLVSYLPMPKSVRALMSRMGGVNLKGIRDSFIGNNIHFDTLYPEQITIGNRVHLTAGCTILTHKLDTSKPGINWIKTRVIIEDDCFIGTNTIICNDVVIGNNSIVGAGSIVTKDIPANEIWAGNPARFVKKRIVK